ncbi:HAD family hydrolase [Ancylobacter dichloromethanicus]|uniref:phosphoglycolate phosphatase n=1 Tax=Ancylobacter dichloromethanicus TaxID=518825 RepID=A0A9W6JAB5_9HYPH|nr:HAD family hydrolase [Ancylobacter dichloromethanicus]MBS7552113.1 HAD family hydrolase [Ancylobacter dichloromethanicus]GLK73846.1 haloacid dehalogenase [Ancylobacter dichloromethanicus]
MNAPHAILFDKDGTLVDFDLTWGPAAGAVMRRLAGDDALILDRLFGASHYLAEERRFLQTSPLIAGSSRQYGPLWADILARRADSDFYHEVDRLFREEGERFLTPIGRPAETLARLHAFGLPLGIATNDAEPNARLQVDRLGLAPYVRAVYGHDSGYGSKPSPGMVQAFSAFIGLPVASIALVGDTRHDLDTARAAGAMAVLVRCGPSPVDAFAHEADLVVDTVEELAELILAGAQLRVAVA